MALGGRGMHNMVAKAKQIIGTHNGNIVKDSDHMRGCIC